MFCFLSGLYLYYFSVHTFSSGFLLEGGFIAFSLGYMIDLNSGAPFGLYSAVCVLTFYTTKLISEGIFIHHIISQMILVVIATLLSKVYLLLVLSMYEPINQLWQQVLKSGVVVLFLNFLLTPLLFFILKKMDAFCGKHIPTKTGSKESEIELT